ncbi:MAG: hypothetical protein JNM39_05490 [Bdellovibrionaceae bacterium]|nr:hypothetical protein [Pseudobdellovibrionaceae bacterium]
MILNSNLTRLVAFGLVVVAGLNLNAKPKAGPKQIEPSQVQRPDCTARNCVYKVQYQLNSVNKLMADAYEMVFPSSFLGSDDKFIAKAHGTDIILIVADNDARSKYLERLAQLDRPTPYDVIPKVVKFEFRVFAMEAGNVDRLNIGIKNLIDKKKSSSSAKSSSSNDESEDSGTAVEMSLGATNSLKIGSSTNVIGVVSNLFSLHFDMNRLKSWSREVISMDYSVTNLDQLGGKTTQLVFGVDLKAQMAMSIPSAEAGLTPSGKVEFLEDKNLVSVTGFSLKYSAPLGGYKSIVEENFIPRQNLLLPLDKPYVLLSTTKQLSSESKGNSFLFTMTNSSDNTEVKLIIVVTASLEKPVTTKMTTQNAANQYQRAFAEDSSKRVQDAFQIENILGYVVDVENPIVGAELFGQKVGFHVDSKAVSKETSLKMIKIKEDNGISGISKITYSRLGALALGSGYTLKTLNVGDMQSGCQKREDMCASIPVDLTFMDEESGATVGTYRLMYYPGEESQVYLRPRQVTETYNPSGSWSSFFGKH